MLQNIVQFSKQLMTDSESIQPGVRNFIWRVDVHLFDLVRDLAASIFIFTRNFALPCSLSLYIYSINPMTLFVCIFSTQILLKNYPTTSFYISTIFWISTIMCVLVFKLCRNHFLLISFLGFLWQHVFFSFDFSHLANHWSVTALSTL